MHVVYIRLMPVTYVKCCRTLKQKVTSIVPCFIGTYSIIFNICMMIVASVVSYRRCLAFTCAKLLQKELDEFLVYWNSHLIRQSRNTNSPAGYPDDMYDMPELFG